MIRPETPPLTQSELAELPVFPLPNAVLFPGVSMGLHVFEPRYRAMMKHCLEHGPRAMAIAHLRPGFESDYEGQPAIHEIAGAGRIVEHRGNADGTYDLILEGTQRVRLHELPFTPPFRRARAETLVEIADARTSELLRNALGPDVLRALAHVPTASQTPIAPPSLEGPPGRVLDLFADRVLRDPVRRQTFLETLDVEKRLALLGEWGRLDRDASSGRTRWSKAN
jgi:ATP-dependent Lon protease